MIDIKILQEIWDVYCEYNRLKWLIEFDGYSIETELPKVLAEIKFLDICPNTESEFEKHNNSHYLLLGLRENTFKVILCRYHESLCSIRIVEKEVQFPNGLKFGTTIFALRNCFNEIQMYNIVPEILSTSSEISFD